MNKPKGLISPQEAKELNDAYTPRCELITRDITKRDDNRSSWYSLEDIKSFLEYAENQAKDLGYEMDGIRIYCGAYPEQDDKPGYSTSFIVPTTNKITGESRTSNSNDIPEADALNLGQDGKPPGANYPQ